jgi:hypothetical protein
MMHRRWKHKKRGSTYVLVGVGTGQSDLHTTIEMQEFAVYYPVDKPHDIWVRPKEEFLDGRFEPIVEKPLPTWISYSMAAVFVILIIGLLVSFGNVVWDVWQRSV